MQYVITDNGSNMVKAFKLDQVAAVTEGEPRSDKGDDEVFTGDECESDNDELEEEDEECEIDVDQDVVDFECEEMSHASVFKRQGLKRLSCFSHTLQLVASSFNKDASAKALLSTAYEVVKQVSKSGKATEALIRVTGKKLVSRSVTRWTSAYLVVNRLLEVKEHLKVVLLDHNLTMLQPLDWEALTHVKALLSKFAAYTNVAGGQQYPTLSLIIPYYIELREHLEEMKKIDSLEKVSKIMSVELERRFAKLLDHNDKDHNPLYMVATLLDPRFKMILETEQIAYAKKECLKLLCNGEYDSENEIAATPPPSDSLAPLVTTAGSESENEPPIKKLRYVFNIIEKKATEKKEIAFKYPKLPELQLDLYIQSTDGKVYSEDTDPISFWNQFYTSYSMIAPFAIDILSAPSSSALVERTFSTAGIATSGHRNRLAKANLEKEVLLKKNEVYYMHIFQ